MIVPSITTDDTSFEYSKEEVTKQKNIEDIDSNNKPQDSVDSESGEKSLLLKEYKGNTLLIELAGGAILGALSILFCLINNFIPPIPGTGMKFFDIIAIPMMVAFLIFGIRAGLLSTVIGCLGILILGEYMAWLGMLAKFLATIPMIVVPWLLLKFGDSISNRLSFLPNFSATSESMKKSFSFLMVPTILFRTIWMFTINLFFTIPLFSGGTVTISSEPKIALLTATMYGLWNIVQGFGDAYLGWLIAYPTQFDKLFGTW
ncbi:hypothetical protein EU523_00935 [Candidatus Heimdallarchaeota archaeon]|nr:MAG: hypothetical protein EU523_00935 [Candidatus Heimdallarchaeota archaeon]